MAPLHQSLAGNRKRAQITPDGLGAEPARMSHPEDRGRGKDNGRGQGPFSRPAARRPQCPRAQNLPPSLSNMIAGPAKPDPDATAAPNLSNGFPA